MLYEVITEEVSATTTMLANLAKDLEELVSEFKLKEELPEQEEVEEAYDIEYQAESRITSYNVCYTKLLRYHYLCM